MIDSQKAYSFQEIVFKKSIDKRQFHVVFYNTPLRERQLNRLS